DLGLPLQSTTSLPLVVFCLPPVDIPDPDPSTAFNSSSARCRQTGEVHTPRLTLRRRRFPEPVALRRRRFPEPIALRRRRFPEPVALRRRRFPEPVALRRRRFPEPIALRRRRFPEPIALRRRRFPEPVALRRRRFPEPVALRRRRFPEPVALRRRRFPEPVALRRRRFPEPVALRRRRFLEPIALLLQTAQWQLILLLVAVVSSPPVYEKHGSSSFSEFRASLYDYWSFIGSTLLDAKRMLPTVLKGEARIIYQSIPDQMRTDNSSMDRLMETFEQRLFSDTEIDLLKDELRSFKQSGRPVHSFAEDIRGAAVKPILETLMTSPAQETARRKRLFCLD
ncbi:hypothetical protein PRIPAC_84111, partial [Pristionchus pacificus]|uniref:Uncharacterized protein n=1 Tax=Pristionchus pacificus TaxID=54126 RepID=A0A2A6BLL2_PRIPA